VERRDDARWAGLAGQDPREILNGKTDFERQLNLDFRKTLGNFRMNLDMKIFPKLF
jgi:hypothetical protein